MITTVPQYVISNHHRFDALIRVRIFGRMPLFVKFVVTRFIRGSVVIIHNSQKKKQKEGRDSTGHALPNDPIEAVPAL